MAFRDTVISNLVEGDFMANRREILFQRESNRRDCIYLFIYFYTSRKWVEYGSDPFMVSTTFLTAQ